MPINYQYLIMSPPNIGWLPLLEEIKSIFYTTLVKVGKYAAFKLYKRIYLFMISLFHQRRNQLMILATGNGETKACQIDWLMEHTSNQSYKSNYLLKFGSICSKCCLTLMNDIFSMIFLLLYTIILDMWNVI